MNRTITSALFAILLLVVILPAQEPEGPLVERVRMMIAAEGFNLELVMIEGRPVSCRFEGRKMSFTQDPDGGMIARSEDGREIIRIVRDEVVAEVAEKARPVRLGLMVTPAPGIVCAQLDLEAGSAIAVTSVEPGLPAARAGLQKHDVIIGINDGLGASEEKLAEAVKALEPGDSLLLHLRRGGRARSIEVVAEVGDAAQPGVPILTDLPLLGRLFRTRGIEGRILDADGRVVAGVVKEAPNSEGDDPLAHHDRSRARYLDLLNRRSAAQSDPATGAKLQLIEQRLANLEALIADLAARLDR